MEREPINQYQEMRCGTSSKTEEELHNEGWIEAWSFHRQIPEQWEEACRKVNGYNQLEGYQVTLANPDDESQRRDGIQIIYFKRPEKGEAELK